MTATPLRVSAGRPAEHSVYGDTGRRRMDVLHQEVGDLSRFIESLHQMVVDAYADRNGQLTGSTERRAAA